MTGPLIAEKTFAATKASGSATIDFTMKTGERTHAHVATDFTGKCAGAVTYKRAETVDVVMPDSKTGYLRYSRAYLRATAESVEEADSQVKDFLNL